MRSAPQTDWPIGKRPDRIIPELQNLYPQGAGERKHEGQKPNRQHRVIGTGVQEAEGKPSHRGVGFRDKVVPHRIAPGFSGIGGAKGGPGIGPHARRLYTLQTTASGVGFGHRSQAHVRPVRPSLPRRSRRLRGGRAPSVARGSGVPSLRFPERQALRSAENPRRPPQVLRLPQAVHREGRHRLRVRQDPAEQDAPGGLSPVRLQEGLQLPPDPPHPRHHLQERVVPDAPHPRGAALWRPVPDGR